MAFDREIAFKLPTLRSSIYLIEKVLFLSAYFRTNVHSTLGCPDLLGFAAHRELLGICKVAPRRK